MNGLAAQVRRVTEAAHAAMVAWVQGKPDPNVRAPERIDWRHRPYIAVNHAKDSNRCLLVFWGGDGHPPREGDEILLRRKDGWWGTLYRVEEVKSSLSEGDVYSLKAVWVPRSQKEIVADNERFGRPKRMTRSVW